MTDALTVNSELKPMADSNKSKHSKGILIKTGSKYCAWSPVLNSIGFMKMFIKEYTE